MRTLNSNFLELQGVKVISYLNENVKISLEYSKTKIPYCLTYFKCVFFFCFLSQCQTVWSNLYIFLLLTRVFDKVVKCQIVWRDSHLFLECSCFKCTLSRLRNRRKTREESQVNSPLFNNVRKDEEKKNVNTMGQRNRERDRRNSAHFLLCHCFWNKNNGTLTINGFINFQA